MSDRGQAIVQSDPTLLGDIRQYGKFDNGLLSVWKLHDLLRTCYGLRELPPEGHSIRSLGAEGAAGWKPGRLDLP